MRRSRSGRRLSAAVMGAAIIMLGVFSKGTALLAKASEKPVITNLEVASSEDSAGVIARCSYQNYTEQSGCEMRLYLYKMENGGDVVLSHKALDYAVEGSSSTPSEEVDEGRYRASVTIDDGISIRQVNSSSYYYVSRSEGSYIVTEEKVEKEEKELMQPEEENGHQIETDSSCIHMCEYILIEQATPEKDALQAYQCSKCGAVFEYIDVPNSAYAAFLKETVNLIQNAQQQEIIISTNRWVSFNREVFEALKIRHDVSMKVNYWYQGEEYSLTIPAGADTELLMDENGFAGFRHIEEVLKQAG